MATSTYALADLPDMVGQTLGVSEWLQVDQARIDAFAHATGDLQWIHVDPVRAAAGPFGTTVAHGFLTLSLLPLMGDQALDITGTRMAVNYGLNKVRFPAPLPVNGRVRGHFKLTACEAVGTAQQLTFEVAMELEGSDKPVCVAESVSRRYP